MSVLHDAIHAKILPHKAKQNRVILAGSFILAVVTLFIGIIANVPNVSVSSVILTSLICGAIVALAATLIVIKVEAIIEHFMS